MLRPLLEDLVFVGGCTTALFITDEAAADVRATFDVDAVIEVKSYVEYARFPNAFGSWISKKISARVLRFAVGATMP